MKNQSIKIILTLLIVLSVSHAVFAQTGGPGPATGVPIDGISGVIMMGLAAIFGKKYLKKDK